MTSLPRRLIDAIRRKAGTRPNGVEPIIRSIEPRIVINAYYKGHCFKCFSGDCISDFILTGKGWDNQLEGILDRTLAESEGDVIEIGANIGASLIPIAAKYPSHTFHCVEAVSDFFVLLEANRESFKAENVKLYNQAVGSTDGQSIEIHVQLGTAGAVADYDGHRYFGAVKIPSVTVDSLFRGKPVAFLKLDVDGFELDVLNGASETIEAFLPKVFMEFHTKLMSQTATDPADVTGVFQHLGYDRISVWTNFGEFVRSTNSYSELLALAHSSEYYVDALFECTDTKRI